MDKNISDIDLFNKMLESKEKPRLTARQYLEWNRKKIPWADTVLEYGKEFIAPDKDLALNLFDRFQKIAPKGRCFENSLYLAKAGVQNGHNTTYAEGVAVVPPGRALIHAWSSYDGKLAIDPTWNLFAHFANYMGIELPADFVYDLWIKKAKNEKIRPGLLWRHWHIYSDPVLEFLKAHR